MSGLLAVTRAPFCQDPMLSRRGTSLASPVRCARSSAPFSENERAESRLSSNPAPSPKASWPFSPACSRPKKTARAAFERLASVSESVAGLHSREDLERLLAVKGFPPMLSRGRGIPQDRDQALERQERASGDEPPAWAFLTRPRP